MTRLHTALIVLFVLCLSISVRPPAAAAEDAVRSSRLGIAFISSIDVPFSEERYENALALGAGWNRWPLYWDRVEARAGQFNWGDYDELIEHDLSYGLRNNVILLGIPSLYREENLEGDTIEGLYEPIFSDDSDDPAPGKAINPENPWARFVQQAVSRYKPGGRLAREQGWANDQGVRVWEIWNEPDYAPFWTGGVYDYARLLKVAYLVIDTVDPDATVMVGGLLFPAKDNFLAKLLNVYQDEVPAPPEHWYMDAIGIHNYGDAWRSGWLTLYVRQTLAEFGLERPIWMTETGVPVWNDYPGPSWMADAPATEMAYATETQQAAFLIQSASYAWSEGAATIIFHQLYDDCGNQPPGTDFSPRQQRIATGGRESVFGEAFGIFRNPANSVCFSQHPQPGTARPVADAYALLARVFGDSSFSRRGLVDETRTDGMITVTFSRPETDERVAVLWNSSLNRLSNTSFPALGTQATLYTMHGEETIQAQNGFYRLQLPAAEWPRQRFLDTRSPIDIGGEPVILVEPLDTITATILEAQTLEWQGPAPAASTPAIVTSRSDDEIAALISSSPTGAVFVSLSNARLRSAPSFENSETVGTLPFDTPTNIIGRSTDNEWVQVDFGGRAAWVAVFVGQVYGALDGVPVIGE
jgi:hypothetical protein